MAVDQPEILTERQVSNWLGLSEPTLFRHRRDGTGPIFIRLSARRVAYRRSAVEEWLTQRERKLINDPENDICSRGHTRERESA
jgi:predicted DNA-binding transcriptional regulator AlpA